jgi:hypothetical protein
MFKFLHQNVAKAYKINICNPFRKMFDSFRIKSIFMENLLLMVLVDF